MSAKTKKTPSKKGMTGFEFGADVLKMNVEAVQKIYEVTVSVMVEGIKAGKTNAPLGLLHTLGYYDLLHGGAYAAPVNARPFYLKNPAASKYYGGDLTHGLYTPGLLGWLNGEALGTSAATQANEVLIDANVPHVFPKLLSDETYAKIVILFNQAATTDLFARAATGVTTLVEGVTKGAERLGVGGDDDEMADLKQKLAALTTLVGKLG